MAASTDMFSNTNQTCLDSFSSELMEALTPFMIYDDDSPSSSNWFQPEPSHHDLLCSNPFSEDTDPGLVGGDYQSTSRQDEYWLGPFTSKELEQLEACFRQPTTPQALEVEIDSQSNVDIATSAIDSQKNKAIERIVKDHGITRQILEQHFGMTLKDAAKSLPVSPSTLK